MLHLLILGQQQLGPRLGRHLVMLPPLVRLDLGGTCHYGALAKGRYLQRAASAAAIARRPFVYNKVTRDYLPVPWQRRPF